jgi:hypothetical protein
VGANTSKAAARAAIRCHGRARAGLVDENLNGRRSAISEYRLILNYEVSFKGGRRH